MDFQGCGIYCALSRNIRITESTVKENERGWIGQEILVNARAAFRLTPVAVPSS